MDERDGLRDRVERPRPIEGGVAAADDDHILASVCVEFGNEVDDAAVHPLVANGDGARLERSDSRSDHDRFAADGGSCRGLNRDAIGVFGEPDRLLAQHVRRIEMSRLFNEAIDQRTTLDGGEARHVEDVFLGVHRGDLPARFWKRVNDRDAESAEPRVVGRVQTCRPGPDDDHVAVVGWHVQHATPNSRCSRAPQHCGARVRERSTSQRRRFVAGLPFDSATERRSVRFWHRLVRDDRINRCTQQFPGQGLVVLRT